MKYKCGAHQLDLKLKLTTHSFATRYTMTAIANQRHILPDGAQLAYGVLGLEHLRLKTPMVLIGGVGTVSGDWEPLARAVAAQRPGTWSSSLHLARKLNGCVPGTVLVIDPRCV